MQKIIPNLWFDKNAEEALNFYASVFKDVKIERVMRYGKSSAEVANMPEGSVMTIEFEIFGQKFIAINGGPAFKFTEAISFLVNCDTQEEIDELWQKLTENGGQESQCGWLKDKYGLSWQIVPPMLDNLIADADSEKSERVMKAMLGMKKIDISELERAAQG